MKRLWHGLTHNDDGTPLLGTRWLGPLLLALALLKACHDAFASRD